MPGTTGQHDSSPLDAELCRFLDALVPPAQTLVVAISGGPDSAALVHALCRRPEAAPRIVAVHVNHRLRGLASDEDEAWVRAFCERTRVPLAVRDGTLDPDDVRHRGVEAAARSVRYRILEEERVRAGAQYAATAHTRSDQAETVLLRMITGRGTWRLSGILPVSADRLVRPLLGVSRDEVRRYLRDHGIDPRHDQSNDDDRFLRNRIRNELLPKIASWNPRIEELLADTASLELDRSRAFDELLAPIRVTHVREEAEAASIRVDPGLSPHVLRSLLLEQIRRLDPSTREVDASSLLAIAGTIPGSPRVVSPQLRATRMDDFIHLQRLAPPRLAKPWAHSIAAGDTIAVAEAGYSISLLEHHSSDGLVSDDRLRQVIQVPFESPAVFEIRNRRPGDRFRPLGMDRDKNLADFLIDRRIPSEERDALPLLVCNDSIAWVAGVEVADEFRVRSSAGRRLEIVAERIGGGR